MLKNKQVNLILFMLALIPLAINTANANISKNQQLIMEAQQQPSTDGIISPNKNAAISSGQTALMPAPTTQNKSTIPELNSAPTQNFSNTNSNNNNAVNNPEPSQTTTPAGPPNIFITPSNNSNSQSSRPVIHY